MSAGRHQALLASLALPRVLGVLGDSVPDLASGARDLEARTLAELILADGARLDFHSVQLQPRLQVTEWHHLGLRVIPGLYQVQLGGCPILVIGVPPRYAGEHLLLHLLYSVHATRVVAPGFLGSGI